MSTLNKPRAPVAGPEAREFLPQADPVLARLIDERPDFRPRAWMDELPPLDAFGTLIFQVAGQQLSVRAHSQGTDHGVPSALRLLAVGHHDGPRTGPFGSPSP